MNELLWFGFGALAMLTLVALWVGSGLPSLDDAVKFWENSVITPWEAFKNRNRK